SLPGGIVSLEPGGEERPVSGGGSKAYIGVRGMDAKGNWHPCVIIIDVNVDQLTARAVRVIQVDDDIQDASDFWDGSAMDVYSHEEDGNLFVAWLSTDTQSPIARFYSSDGEPLSPSFWVSPLGANDFNSGPPTVKCCQNAVCAGVAWLSESFEPGLNCKGEQMDRDTMVRFFHPPWAGPTPTATFTPSDSPTPSNTYTPTSTPSLSPAPSDTPTNKSSDIDGNGHVNANDLLILLEEKKKKKK
ncbi:MAG: hypothetical protein KDD43_17210, partial [Bdellovibrionales bacterium]|nr:hypothetical protein [Bdellovibrionales bacterium]